MKTTFGKFGIEAELIEKSSEWPADDSKSIDRFHHSRYCVSVWEIIPEGRLNRISFDFWTSVKDWEDKKFEMTEIELLHAFYCLLSDGLSVKQNDSFQSWCREFGYYYENPDHDSEIARCIARNRKTYKSCFAQWAKVERLGLDESSVCDLINELSEAGV